ncbi:MAG TPA: hypothetical protein VFU41_01025 [Gemmatimonadales bacterium]|nr:hypothetical protein [Gemmatimonadales bacterium]
MIHRRLLYGPLLLLLYQGAPIAARQDSLGRYRVTVGFGGGQWENEEFSCEGNLLSTTPVRYRSGGVQLDAWPDPHLRLTAFGGSTGETVGATIATDPQYSSSYVERYDGPFGGAQVAFEGQRFGIGIGVTTLSGVDGFTGAAPYVRIGNMDKPHLRMDVMTPNPALPSVGWGRVGVGFNNGHLRGTGGFLGLGFGPVDYNSKAALIGEIRLPIAPRLAGQVQGLVGPGENASQWSAGLGLRYDFGARE